MDVFLSYNRLDTAHARSLNDWLVGQGVTTFFDQRDLGGGQLWVADLERTISMRPRRSPCWWGRTGSAIRSNMNISWL